MTKEYCPRGKVQKFKEEIWSLKIKGFDVVVYTTRFNDLVTLCPNVVPTESRKIERYIWRLVPPYQGNVLPLNPTTFDSTKKLAQRLINHGVPPPTISQKLQRLSQHQPKQLTTRGSAGTERRANQLNLLPRTNKLWLFVLPKPLLPQYPRSNMQGVYQSAPSAISTKTAPIGRYTAPTTTGRAILSSFTRHLQHQSPRSLVQEYTRPPMRAVRRDISKETALRLGIQVEQEG